ncbi:MAG: hypothetical protein CW691_05320, partial [Candidatus Bathyarchaeum sp.]
LNPRPLPYQGNAQPARPPRLMPTLLLVSAIRHAVCCFYVFCFKNNQNVEAGFIVAPKRVFLPVFSRNV